MTYLKQFPLLLLVVAASGAHADPSKLLGTWTGPCEDDQGYSFQNRTVIRPDGQMVNINLNYTGTGCTGTPTTDSSTAPYQILSETATAVTTAIQPAAAGEGSPVEIVAKFEFQSPTEMTLEVLRAKVVRSGVPTELNPGEVSALPITSYTRN